MSCDLMPFCWGFRWWWCCSLWIYGWFWMGFHEEGL